MDAEMAGLQSGLFFPEHFIDFSVNVIVASAANRADQQTKNTTGMR